MRRPAAKKTAKKTMQKKHATSKKPAYKLDTEYEAYKKNKAALWETYHELQKRATDAWNKLRVDMKRKAPMNVLLEDRNHLVLLLGECNYMTQECMNCEAANKKKRR